MSNGLPLDYHIELKRATSLRSGRKKLLSVRLLQGQPQSLGSRLPTVISLSIAKSEFQLSLHF